jgi:bifunctional non-homologous end joining protein LigD
MKQAPRIVRINGRLLELSNLSKDLFPKSGFTKKQIFHYYRTISPAILPHLRGRPLTLKRYANGVEEPYFYEKRCPSHKPKWMQSVHYHGIDFCKIDDLSSLIWAANLASIELHVQLSREPELSVPTHMVFDLDPGEPAAILECCEVALKLREVLEKEGLESFCKTSGSKGLQLYVPLNTEVTYSQIKDFSRALAQYLERLWPSKVVSRSKKELRAGKVLIDWSQNDPNKTTVCAYSLRALSAPGVSTPVSWKEVFQAYQRKRPEILRFSPSQVLVRFSKTGDLFLPVLELKQKLRPFVANRAA